MKIEYSKLYFKDLKKLDKRTLQKVIALTDDIEGAKSLKEIKHLKKMRGYENFYRIRLGGYRIGLEFENNLLTFHRILLRKDMYKYFP